MFYSIDGFGNFLTFTVLQIQEQGCILVSQLFCSCFWCLLNFIVSHSNVLVSDVFYPPYQEQVINCKMYHNMLSHHMYRILYKEYRFLQTSSFSFQISSVRNILWNNVCVSHNAYKAEDRNIDLSYVQLYHNVDISNSELPTPSFLPTREPQNFLSIEFD